MGTKGNIKFKPDSNMLYCQKGTALLNVSKKCLLCLHEKLEMINYPRPEELLNKRCELISKYKIIKL